nr:uncharacterized protein LOC117866726 isoform X5 [Setaria viridis]
MDKKNESRIGAALRRHHHLRLGSANNILVPIFYFMIRDLHVAQKEDDIGFYAGFLGKLHHSQVSIMNVPLFPKIIIYMHCFQHFVWTECEILDGYCYEVPSWCPEWIPCTSKGLLH